MQATYDRGASDKAGSARAFLRDSSNDFIRARHWRQRIPKCFEAEKFERVFGIVLRFVISERRRCLSAISADFARQAEAQPVLAGNHMTDAPIAFRLVFLDPGQNSGGSRSVW
ncbi:hypothetical protein D3C81_1886470 [compost metagenome]